MRMGQKTKPRRGEKVTRADAKGKPGSAAGASVVGKLSPDIISTYFAPELIGRAAESLESYADDMMKYEDAVLAAEDQTEAEIEGDGTVNKEAFPLPPPTPLYHSQYWVNELEEVLTETSDHFQAKNGGWKVVAKAARFERLMEERYGRFRPFVKNHPEVEQFVRSVQRKYATGYFSPFRQGKAPIPKSTAVIILFMMQRGNLRWEVTMLAVLFFLVGLQPWALVVLVAGAHTLYENRRKRPMKPMKSYIPTVEPYYRCNVQELGSDDAVGESDKQKNDILLRPVGKELGKEEEIDTSDFNVIIVGSGPSTLYTAAILSRAGRKVLVLSPKVDASGCYTIDASKSYKSTKFKSIPFDIESSNISKISKVQNLLAPALSTTTDYQGGIRFAQIGSKEDGYAFEILSVPGMGVDKGDADNPFVLRADGKVSLMEDAALCLGDGFPGENGDIGDSTTGSYSATCEVVNANSNGFYMSKLQTSKWNNDNTFQEAAIRPASAFLGKGFPLNAHARSLMAAIGMKSENIKPSMTSMGAHVTNISASLSGEGIHYPVGGPRALCHALGTVVEQSGGRVVTNVPILSLIFEEEIDQASKSKQNKDGEDDPPRCVGVQLTDKRKVKFDMAKKMNDGVPPVVISMNGLVTTFIRLLPEEIRVKHKVPLGLPALAEQRPVFKFLFVLDGSAADLEVTGADFYRVPGAALAQDEINPETGEIKLGEIGWADETNDEEAEVDSEAINQDPSEGSEEKTEVPSSSSGRSKRQHALPVKKKKVKFEKGASWMQIAFPSAKDPSFKSRHGDVTTCVVTVEADDDFVTLFDTKPKLYFVHKDIRNDSSGNCQRLLERVKRDLLDIYPQLDGKILHTELCGPINRGLSHNPERYAARGVRPVTPYPGLFVGGSDLTIGESFAGSIVGGWLTANAVVGYRSFHYMFLQKTVTSDISMFLEQPDLPDEEDLAVPYDEEEVAATAVVEDESENPKKD